MTQYLPNGSYKETSRNIKVILSAECQKLDGSWQESTLDITNVNADIVNIDGSLQEVVPTLNLSELPNPNAPALDLSKLPNPS